MDGKEFRINAPPNTGSLFYNYKCYFSFKMLAVCDAYYRFTWVYVGDYGSVSDLSTFHNTGLYQALERGEGNIPASCYLPRSNTLMQFYYIGDEIFTQQQYIMVPYPRRNRLDEKKKHFNYRLSKARNCIEDAFGIMCSKWQIINKKLGFKLETSIAIAKAVVCLHNYRITRRLERAENVDDEIPQNISDARQAHLEGENEDVEDPHVQNDQDEIRLDALQQRNRLADYFSSDAGSIPEEL